MVLRVPPLCDFLSFLLHCSELTWVLVPSPDACSSAGGELACGGNSGKTRGTSASGGGGEEAFPDECKEIVVLGCCCTTFFFLLHCSDNDVELR